MIITVKIMARRLSRFAFVFLYTSIFLTEGKVQGQSVLRGHEMSNGTSNNSVPSTKCRQYKSEELMKIMRDEGFYNPRYMAEDMEAAARQFPDLTDQPFIMASKNFSCDESCRSETHRLQQVLQIRRHYTSPSRIDNPQLHLSGELTLRYNWQQTALSEEQPTWSREKRHLPSGQFRFKRQFEQNVVEQDSDQQVVGKTYPIECTAAGHEEVYGYQQLCSCCRTVRELPLYYFPRILNEVVCRNSNCLKGHGRCTQKFLPMHILQNVGSNSCQDWQSVEISVRVFCDCLIDSFSPLFDRFIH